MSKEIVDYLRNAQASYHPGWGGPEFSGWQDEQMSWKTTSYLGDWSFLWDIEVSGPEAMKFFRDTGVNSVQDFAVGQAKHLVQCDEQGNVIAEGVLMRLGEESFSTQSTTAFYSAFLLSSGKWDATWSHRETFQFQVSGPTALAVCEQAAGESLTDVRFMRFREVTIGGIPVLALRQGMAGEVGFEFHGPASESEKVREALLAAGEPFGIRRLGRRTAMINHLEAAFPTGGWHYLAAQFDPAYGEFIMANFDIYGITTKFQGSFEPESIEELYSNPFELGWGRSVKFDHEFVGRDALERIAAGSPRQRVTLEFSPADVAEIYASLFDEKESYRYLEIPHNPRWIFWADRVENELGELVGLSSTPGYSYHSHRVLSLSYLEAAYANPGTEVFVVWGEPGTRQKRIKATVRPAPYKTDNRRSELASSSSAS